MNFFDSHCHLDTPAIYQDLENVLARAKAAGVTRMCSIGVGEGTSRAELCVELARKYPAQICATIGVNPHDAAAVTEAELQKISQMAQLPEIAAIGEIGLDYFYMLRKRCMLQSTRPARSGTQQVPSSGASGSSSAGRGTALWTA